MHGEHGPVDVADEAVSEDHLRNFPVPAMADIQQLLNAGNPSGVAAGLLP